MLIYSLQEPPKGFIPFAMVSSQATVVISSYLQGGRAVIRDSPVQLLQVSVLVMVIETLVVALSYHPRQETRFAGAHPSVLAAFCLAQHPSPSCPCHPQGSHPTVLPFPHHGLQTMNIPHPLWGQSRCQDRTIGHLPGHVLGAAHFTSNNVFRYQGCWNRSQAAAPLPSPFTSSEDCAEAP